MATFHIEFLISPVLGGASHETVFAAQAADRIIVMDEGRVMDEAAPTTFITSPVEERTHRFLDREPSTDLSVSGAKNPLDPVVLSAR